MSANADNNLPPIEDLSPVDPVSQPEVVESETPAPETEPKPAAAPTDKAPANPPPQIPKWRLDEVLEQNRALKAQLQQHAPQTQQQAAPAAPKQEDFSTYEEYIRAEAKHTAQQAVQSEWRNIRQQEQQEIQNRSFQERVQTADDKFNEQLFEANAKNPALIQKLSNAPSLRPDLFLAMKESDAPLALAEHLADNPAFILKLNQMPPDRAIREMTMAEMKLTTVNGGPAKMPSSQAPNLDPVGKGNKPSGKNPYDSGTSAEDYVRATRRVPGR